MAFWQNKPNLTTPKSAENLSRAERYLPATAGANGDFFVNINGASGLAEGDIVRISFPAATVPTANARLSIDGGATYIDIKFFDTSYQLLGRNIENQKIELFYDGTSFKTKKEWILVLYDNAITNLNLGYGGNGITFNTTVAAGSVTRTGLPNLTGLEMKDFNFQLNYNGNDGENVWNTRKISTANSDRYFFVNFRDFNPGDTWMPMFEINPKTNGSWIFHYQSSKVMTGTTILNDTGTRKFYIRKMTITN